MAYKFSKGKRGIGDIEFEDDADTGLDFEENYIGFDTDGSTSMVLSGSRVGIGTTTPEYRLQVAGNIGLNQYIYHNGDADTRVNFTDNTVKIETGGAERLVVENSKTTLNVPLHITQTTTEGLVITKDDGDYREIQFKTNIGGSLSDTAFIQVRSDEGMSIGCQSVNDEIIFFTTDAGGTPAKALVITSDKKVGIGERSWDVTSQAPEADLHVLGSVKNEGSVYRKLRDVGSTGNITTTDYMIRGIQNDPITLTLPAKTDNAGQILIIKDMLGNAGSPNNKTITINAATGESIDGSSSYVINTNRGSITLMCDGINGWMIIGKYSG